MEQVEPEGWFRHATQGRRRLNSDPYLEYWEPMYDFQAEEEFQWVGENHLVLSQSGEHPYVAIRGKKILARGETCQSLDIRLLRQGVAITKLDPVYWEQYGR